MRKTRRWILVLLFITLPWHQAGAEDELDFSRDPHVPYSVTDRNQYACLASNERIRAVYVEYSEKGGEPPCVVIFEKASPEEASRKILWRAQSDAEFCEMRARELVEKLRRGGWKCGLFRDVLGIAE